MGNSFYRRFYRMGLIMTDLKLRVDMENKTNKKTRKIKCGKTTEQ